MALIAKGKVTNSKSEGETHGEGITLIKVLEDDAHKEFSIRVGIE